MILKKINILILYTCLSWAAQSYSYEGNELELDADKLLAEIELQKTADPVLAKQHLELLEINFNKLNQEQKDLYELYLAHSFAIHGNYSKAQEALIRLASRSENEYITSRSHSMLSNIFAFEGKFKEAFIYSAKSLENIESLSDKSLHKFAILQNAASLFKQADIDNKAMEHSRQLLRIAEGLGEPVRLCAANYEMASWELKHDSTVMAQSRVEDVIKYCGETGDTLFKLLSFEIQAQFLLLNKKPQESVDLLLAWKDKVDQVGYKKFKNLYETRLAESYSELGNYQVALDYGLSAYQSAKALNDITMLIEVCSLLANIYTQQDELEKSVKFYQEYINYEKQLRFITNKRKMAYYMVSSRQ